MPDLSDTARLVLTNAADHPDRFVPLLRNKPAVVALNCCGALLKPGLLERVAPRQYEATEIVISNAEGHPRAYRITDAGLAAIGREPPTPATEPWTLNAAASEQLADALSNPPAPNAALRGAADLHSAAFAEYPLAQANAASWDRSAKGRHERLRLAADTMLKAWHALEAAPQAEPLTCNRIAVIVDTPMVAAAEMLRSALQAASMGLAAKAAPPMRATRAGAGQIRPGSKLEKAIGMLERPNGATGPEMEEALGWAPHTVRGFISTLGRTRPVSRAKLAATDTERACTRYSISR